MDFVSIHRLTVHISGRLMSDSGSGPGSLAGRRSGSRRPSTTHSSASSASNASTTTFSCVHRPSLAQGPAADAAQQTWHKSASLAADHQAIANLRTCFQRLTSILNDESRSPAPHLCLSFAASQQIYSTVSKIASTAYHEAMVRDAVAVFGALIDSEEEDFLENSKFAESLMTFIGRITTSGSTSVGEDTDAEIVELLFGIAAKIRLQPDILPVWFTSDASNVGSRMAPPKANFAGVTQKEDFPLCYQLIDHVHHEGRIGDFARTGLLYIFESASKSKSLEWWIVGSDLPTLMATGLGALYSQLSRSAYSRCTLDTVSHTP